MVTKTIVRDAAFIQERINITDSECWEWQRSITWDGYGQVTGLGEHRAHRLSWIIHKGLIPLGAVICHRCDNRLCVNPEHLFVGSHSDNRQDAMSKGRIDAHAASKRANDAHRIPQHIVEAILKHVETIGGSQDSIAKLHGVSRQTVSNIITRNYIQETST